jgi:predicted NUDIX family NTP pyrophosphohydrolase
MPRVSAGLLMYRRHPDRGVEVLLVHPGGPFWARKDLGAWSIPKGEAADGEVLLDAAQREFEEEVGFKPVGPFIPLSPIRQKAGKIVHAWAFAGDCNVAACRSNMVRMEWPPRSGKWVEFPEIDRAEFFDVASARSRLNAAQVPLLEALQTLINPREST